MLTLAVANAKGGTLKTTAAVHLAVGLAKRGHRVLMADLDPQGNASTWLLGDIPSSPGAAEALKGRLRLEDAVEVPGCRGLLLLHGGPNMAGADTPLATVAGGVTLLRGALAGLAERFDYAVLDCPPSLGLTVVSALVAADGVIVPLLPSFLALAGLARLEETLERVGAKARLLGVVLVGVDPREAITGEIRELLRREIGRKLYRAEVRVSTAAKVLPATRRTAWDAGADPRGAEDYPAFIAETLTRLKTREP